MAYQMKARLAAAIVAEPHAHTWRITEVEHLEHGAIRRMDCPCGAVDNAIAC